MENMGWKYIDDIVWIKPEGASINRNGGFYQHRKPVAYKPNIVSETISIFQKPADFLIDTVVRSYDGDVLEKSLVTGKYERSNIWKINPETTSKHLAPYPKELSDKIVKYYSYVGDLVLDPFMGSGTTAISCVDNKRDYLGIELHQEYVDMAETRIKKCSHLINSMNNFLVIIYFTFFAVIAGGAFAMMWANVQSINEEMRKPKKPQHPEAPKEGDELLYVDLTKERLEQLYKDD
jgi:DNA modification methylase